ncbi:hypothetical protein EYF80_055918 [Liparis tanakae]|uniref:Uncharacterized protein n=1 Tax=Liparis tanakae TaxID=230148 RepID=A0A4Z2EYH8_9TELE|nr:hypothetical protein EYF80_055918 [Liparis tanakae]
MSQSEARKRGEAASGLLGVCADSFPPAARQSFAVEPGFRPPPPSLRGLHRHRAPTSSRRNEPPPL